MTDTATPKNRGPLAFIVLVLVIDAMGIGIILPVMPDLLRDVLGGSLAQAALWGGILSSSFAVMQFLFSPAIGALSDRYGRRPILLVSLFIMAIDYVVLGLAWTIWILLAARLVSGIAAATQSTAGAFIADISKPEDKAANFGLMGAAFGIGFVFGPMIGGFLGQYGPRTPFYAAAGLACLAFVIGWLILPETVNDQNRRKFELARANPLGAFAKISELPGLGRLLIFYFFYEFAFMVYPAVWSYFAVARFGWGPAMIGISLMTFGISMAIVQGGLIRVVIRLLGDRGTVVYGLLFNVAALIILGLVTNGMFALFFTPISALGAVVTPAIQSMMSRRADDDQQGELQGVLSSIRAVAMIGSPLVMTGIFSLFTASDTKLFLPGAPFLFAALLVALCFSIIVTTPRKNPTAN